MSISATLALKVLDRARDTVKVVTKPVSSNKISTKVNTSKTSKNKATNTKAKVVELEPCPEHVSSKALDVLQFIFEIIRFIPGFGDVCSGINALIYYARSLYLDAIISVGGIVFSLVADTILKPLNINKMATDFINQGIEGIITLQLDECTIDINLENI